MKNNKIALYIFLKDITLDGGAERIVFNMANEFVKLYDNVTLISRFSTNERFHYNLDPRVKVHFIEKKGLRYTENPTNRIKNLLYLFQYAVRITKPINEILKRESPFNHTPVLLTAGYETPINKLNGAKFVGLDESCAIVWKTKRLDGKLYMFVRRWLQRKLDIGVVLSDQQLDDWAVLKKPIRVIPNFITDIPESVLPQNKREKTIVAAGRMLDGQKGFDRLIETYAALAHKFPEWKLRIFGEGYLKESYQKLIDDLSVGQFVELKPYSTNIYDEYGKASIFAMSSRWEGFGLVTTEAMACGAVPVAIEASKPSGTSFILKDLPECLAPENDMARFSQILEQMMRDEHLREDIARKGRRIVYDRFSPEVAMANWSALFDDLTK